MNLENTSGFLIVDGVLVNNPVDVVGKVHYGNLRTAPSFEELDIAALSTSYIIDYIKVYKKE